MDDTPPSLPRWVRLLDAVSVVLFFVIIFVAAFGGLKVGLFGIIIRATSLGRLVAEFAVVVAIRHWLRPRPWLPFRLWRGIAAVPIQFAALRARWPTLTAVTPMWLATRVSVLLVGYLAVGLIGYSARGVPWRLSANELWNLPARWDTGWYLGIAVQGYGWNPNEASQQNLNFFPALPMAMRLGALVTDNVVWLPWVGVLTAILAFLGALVYLHRLMVSLTNHRAADGAVMLIATYPFAVFFSAAYAESLYLLGAVGAFYHLRRRDYAAATGCGLLAGLSRPNGTLLAIPLLAIAVAEAWHTRKTGERRAAAVFSWLSRVNLLSVAAACMPIAGMLLYSARAYVLTGHPFIWATLQQKAWGRTYQGLDTTLLAPFGDMWNMGAIEYTTQRPVTTLHLAAALFALVAIWPVFRRFGLPFALLIAVNILVALLAGGLTSMGRFTSVLFPVFMWLGAAVPQRHLPAWAAAFAMGQAMAAAAFFTWRPLF